MPRSGPREPGTSCRGARPGSLSRRYGLAATSILAADAVTTGSQAVRRDDETHHNMLINTGRVPALLAAEGVQAKVARAFGTEQLPAGLPMLIGHRVG